jgi:hypothetical protein
MSVFQHPHRLHGIIRTPLGAFVVSRGLVEAPDDVGETLGWRRVDGDDPAASGAHDLTAACPSPAGEPQRPVRATVKGPAPGQKSSRHASPVDDQLRDIVEGLRELLRSRHRVTVPTRGIDLVFDAGILAMCRACGVMWRVSRAHYRQAAWWSCPRGCSPARRGAPSSNPSDGS